MKERNECEECEIDKGSHDRMVEGVRYKKIDNLKAVRAEFSTLS
jgi:hypothetical protein